jgi:hypothetical protein
MEDELWHALYPLVVEEHSRRPRHKRVRSNDAVILLVALWAVLHDRPISWACRAQNWRNWARNGPGGEPPWAALPSPATMSRRLRTLSVQLLLEQVFVRLLHATRDVRDEALCLCRRIDSKPLPVGGFTKDRDARRRGYATGGLARGYKIFTCWCKHAAVPEVLVLGPMNLSDPAGAVEVVDRLLALHPGGRAGGYLVADVTHDSNALHDHVGPRGFQLVAPRKQPGAGLGHGQHAPGRLRAIELLEGPSAPSFGAPLYALREAIERDYGNAGSFGGGLQPLPNFVRRPRRVALWVVGKFIINGIRACEKHGVAA